MKIEVTVILVLVLVANLALESKCWMCSPFNCPRSKIFKVANQKRANDYRLAACADGKGLCIRRLADITRDEAEPRPQDEVETETEAVPDIESQRRDMILRRIEAMHSSEPAKQGRPISGIRMRTQINNDSQ